jgi:hypothetical protein
MHRCFIPDITLLICSELRNVKAQKSLAALAQTCWALSEPSLDALWYELHNLLPLVKCMPPDLWELKSGQHWTELVRLSLIYVVLHCSRRFFKEVSKANRGGGLGKIRDPCQTRSYFFPRRAWPRSLDGVSTAEPVIPGNPPSLQTQRAAVVYS